jgi:hypothetical protein
MPSLQQGNCQARGKSFKFCVENKSTRFWDGRHTKCGLFSFIPITISAGIGGSHLVEHKDPVEYVAQDLKKHGLVGMFGADGALMYRVLLWANGLAGTEPEPSRGNSELTPDWMFLIEQQHQGGFLEAG